MEGIKEVCWCLAVRVPLSLHVLPSSQSLRPPNLVLFSSPSPPSPLLHVVTSPSPPSPLLHVVAFAPCYIPILATHLDRLYSLVTVFLVIVWHVVCSPLYPQSSLAQLGIPLTDVLKVLSAVMLLGNTLFYEAKNQELQLQGMEGADLSL